jgi:hypothetical protein
MKIKDIMFDNMNSRSLAISLAAKEIEDALQKNDYWKVVGILDNIKHNASLSDFERLIYSADSEEVKPL